MAIHYTSNINDIDTAKTLLLIDVSLQAYAAFDKENPTVPQTGKIATPEGYDFVECWTGVDSIFNHDKSVEVYGVVFRSQAAPYTYLFGFRGTTSFMDMLDDAGTESKAFTPFDTGVAVPSAVAVESGFFDVYTETAEDTPSMQSQLFALIDAYNASDKPIDQLLVTGHSLGASLSTLFTLDLNLSRPKVSASLYNFASPRVGNSEFVRFYESQPAQQKPATGTLRIQNIYDKVPCVPTEAMGYQHLSNAFLVAFYKDNWIGKLNFLDSHSSFNYHAVLNCAATTEGGICLNEDLEVPKNGYAVTSEKPDPGKICSFW